MAKTIQFKRGTTAQVNAFTGALGEIVVDTDKDVLVVHDGATQGGFAVAAKANTDNTVRIVNRAGTNLGDISASGLFNNTLTSTATNQALTAAQGKVLNDNKLNISAALGYNQTYQDVSASRVVGTTYTNTTGSPILVLVSIQAGSNTLEPFVDGVTLGSAATSGTYINYSTTSFIVPNGSTYGVATGLGTSKIWVELR